MQYTYYIVKVHKVTTVKIKLHKYKSRQTTMMQYTNIIYKYKILNTFD